MPLSEMVIKSKLIPPHPHKAVFHRARLQNKLKDSLNYPLTVVYAGTGYGKTTALIELSDQYKQVFWYNITEPDRDPALFLAHLVSAFLPGSAHLVERLEESGGAAANAVFTALLNQLTLDLEEDAVLILDDYHLVSDVQDISRWFDQLVENHPPRLHIAIACRKIPETPAFIRWRVKGTLLLIDQADLSFDEEEISLLFSEHYAFPITAEQSGAMYAYTDGWIIALQMIWQRLQTSHSKHLDHILAELPSAFSEVFYFLAQEVLMRQPQALREFLVSSAVLRQLDAANCNALLGITNSADILQELVEKGLFIFSVDSVSYRYQRLFQDFLLDQDKNDPEKIAALHKKAAFHFIQTGEYEEAIYHLFACGERVEAAKLIETSAPHLLETGRLRTIAKWIENLEDSLLDLHPRLWLLSGDVHRLQSNFEDAISTYNRAEKVYLLHKDLPGRSQALRSKAQVYLDTIRPLKASSLLEEAVSLLEPQEHPAEVAILLDQLAENKLNLGKPEEAIALHKEASMLRSESDPDDIYLEARALLRTGRLQEAVTLLEPYQATFDQTHPEQRPQRFHREMPLLLSLIHLMLGNIDKGEKYAREGIEIGHRLDSPFVEAVGWMRMGHTCQLYPQLPWRAKRLMEAKECYERSIDLVRPFNVTRVQVEPLWGLCRFYGYQGNLVEARHFAEQAIEIADSSGDQWFVALLQNTLGTSYALDGQTENAFDWLGRSVEKFKDVGDIYGHAAANCALLFNYWQSGSPQAALEHFAVLAPQLKADNTGILLTRPTHVGMQDVQSFIPLLIEAFQQGIEKEWISSLLPTLDANLTNYHPGYGLDIRTLGQFEVWRGKNLTNPRDWQREKARQLFQFFINNRGKWFTREQLSDRLWSELDIEASAQNLKVALNALNRALEPHREPGQSPFFITHRESLYGLNPAAQINLDIDDFLTLASAENVDDLEEALTIYRGDYLCENTAEGWSHEMREQLHETYLNAALHLARLHFQADRWDEAMKISHEILSIDPCNEPAFQILMHCHAARGNRAAVHSVYQRCVNTLNDELDVSPSSETTALWQQLTQ